MASATARRRLRLNKMSKFAFKFRGSIFETLENGKRDCAPRLMARKPSARMRAPAPEAKQDVEIYLQISGRGSTNPSARHLPCPYSQTGLNMELFALNG